MPIYINNYRYNPYKTTGKQKGVLECIILLIQISVPQIIIIKVSYHLILLKKYYFTILSKMAYHHIHLLFLLLKMDKYCTIFNLILTLITFK